VEGLLADGSFLVNIIKGGQNGCRQPLMNGVGIRMLGIHETIENALTGDKTGLSRPESGIGQFIVVEGFNLFFPAMCQPVNIRLVEHPGYVRQPKPLLAVVRDKNVQLVTRLNIVKRRHETNHESPP
jgi:hypothetical protein